MKKIVAVAVGLAALAASAEMPALARTALEKPMLPGGSGLMSYITAFNEVEAADAAADDAWRNLKTRAEYDAYRARMCAKMIEAVGGFPARTPLNAKVVATVPRTYYQGIDYFMQPSLRSMGFAIKPPCRHRQSSSQESRRRYQMGAQCRRI